MCIMRREQNKYFARILRCVSLLVLIGISWILNDNKLQGLLCQIQYLLTVMKNVLSGGMLRDVLILKHNHIG